MVIKRITLRLYATLRLTADLPAAARKPGAKPARFERILYEHEWPNLEHHSNSTSASPPTSLGAHTLHAGNHALPFDHVLPGSVDESVEGLENAQVIYKLVATIERGRFANNLVAKRHMRVVRTLGPDALELSQTMSMENIWPNKIEYSISVPAKAVAMGSFTPMEFNLTPLLKGLKLGAIKVQLIEYRTLETPSGQTADTNAVVSEHSYPAPEDGLEGQDNWLFTHEFPMPSSLSQCTQDCEIGTYINVVHKLRFTVCLLNPAGHTSELRAALPVCVFISPNVSITSLRLTPSGNAQTDEDHLFQAAVDYQGHQTGADLNAPPKYQDHIYDALWSEIPIASLESPIASEATTPLTLSRRNSLETHDNSGFGPQDRSRLLSHLYALQERQNREDGHISSVLEQSGSSALNLTALTPRFSSRSTSGASTPRDQQQPLSMLHMTAASSGSSSSHTPATNVVPYDVTMPPGSPDFFHLSHPGSPAFGGAVTPPVVPLDIESLSRVPSYNTAVTSDTAAESLDYTPSYEQPSSLPSSLPRQPSPALLHGSSSSAAFQRQSAMTTLMPKTAIKSAPGSSVHLSALTSQIARASLAPLHHGHGVGGGDGSSTHSSSTGSNTPAVAVAGTQSVPDSRATSSSNLFGMVSTSAGGSGGSLAKSGAFSSSAGAGTGSSSSGGGGFFRTSSKTHLASLNGGSSSSSALAMTNGSSSASHAGGGGGGGISGGSSSSSLSRSIPGLKRNSSSRSLLDEASRFLHLTSSSSKSNQHSGHGHTNKQ